MRVSVLVSTRNRCEKLRLFLEAMKNSGSSETEVLVIDNDSNDATQQVAAEYASLQNPVFRYLLEPVPGKSRALNSAIREARGDIIAFTDDDCIPDSAWVRNIKNEFDNDAALAVLGGRVELYDAHDVAQATLLSTSRRFVKTAAEVCYSPTIIGANMSFRKTVLTAIRGFDPVLGPGAVCKAAEDLDLVYRSLRGGFKIVYSPDVVVAHNHGRRTEADENRTSFAYAFGRGALYCKHVLRFDFQIARVAVKELYGLTKTLAKGVITRTNFPYHRLVFPAFFLGAFSYCRARLFPWRLLSPSLPEQHAKRQTV